MIWEIDERETRIEGLDEDGRPDPAYAAALGLVPAPIGRRILATVIEAAILVILQLPYLLMTMPTLWRFVTGRLDWYGVVNHPNFVLAVVGLALTTALTTIFVVVQLVLHGRKGVTLGKGLTGLRTVNVKSLERPGFWRMVARAAVLYASNLLPVIGPALLLVSPLLDREKRGRGWLDAVGQSWLVDVARGLDPYHKKKMRIARKTIAVEPVAEGVVLPSLATSGHAQGYTPGARTASGVVGAARPHAPGAQPNAGLLGQPPSPVTPTLAQSSAAQHGGYRPGDVSAAPQPRWQPPAPPAAAPGGVAPAPAEPARVEPARVEPARVEPAPSSPVPPPAPQAARAPASAPVASTPTALPASPVDDATVRRAPAPALEDDLEQTRVSAKRDALAVLVFDSGERFAITGSALIGRNPGASTDEVVAHLIPLADDTRTVSKTHVLIAATSDGLVVVDRASTNGSALERDGAETPLVPLEPRPITFGDVVRFGDRWLEVRDA